MKRLFFATLALALVSTLASAQDRSAEFSIGGDHFYAGQSAVHDTGGGDDVFMAGQVLRIESDISGSAYMAGQSLEVGAPIGGDAHLAGMTVTVRSPVAGDVSVAASTVDIRGAIGGDLRAGGAEIFVEAPVAGYALLSGASVHLNGVISGDAQLSAPEVSFGPNARIDGQLLIVEHREDAIDVPDSVVGADKVTRTTVDEWEQHDMPRIPAAFSWRQAIWTFVKGVIVVAVASALVAAVMPDRLATLRRSLLATPFRALWIGFLAQSAVVGSAILLAMTLVGLLAVPFVLILAVLGALVGYVIAAYSIGVGAMLAIGRAEPTTLGERALAGAAGALIAGIVALVPWIGWLFVLAAILAGIGALAQHLFRPAFFGPTGSIG